MNATAAAINSATSDNSSDSASHNRKSAKTEIEIVDLKIVKCINEINNMKQRIHNEWSKQMNDIFIKDFYQSDASANDSASATHNDSLSNSGSLNNTPKQQQQTSSKLSSNADIEKKVQMLHKKLHSYEKRRQKLRYEQNRKEQQQQQDSAAAAAAASTTTNGATISNGVGAVVGSSGGEGRASASASSETSDTASANAANSSGVTAGSLFHATTQPSLLSASLNSHQLLASRLRNNSFAVGNSANSSQQATPGKLTSGTAQNDDMLNVSGHNAAAFRANSQNNISGGAECNDNNNKQSSTAMFYINSTTPAAATTGATSTANAAAVSFGENTVDDMLNNKLSFDRNLFFMQVEQQFYEMKMQQLKMQSDIDDIQKKMLDNQQAILKELQHTCSQISEPVHKLSFNLYKSYDQKIEELKSSLDRSFQSFSYNLTHCHRDVKEIKEDVAYTKNRVEMVEKANKSHSLNETNPTNYYQLFYKLLDILLTLATIVLLAFTNMIASIKFIFLLYPRTIVILLLIYFFFFCLVDFETLDTYFHRVFLQDSNFSATTRYQQRLLHTASSAEDETGANAGGGGGVARTNLTYLSRFLQAVYGLVYHSKTKGTAPSPSSTSSSTATTVQ